MGIAIPLALGLLVFWGVSLRNTLMHKEPSQPPSPGFPMSLWPLLVGAGSLAMFAEALALIAGDVTGSVKVSLDALTALGLAGFDAGCILHAWSVETRGRYATSWSMGSNHKLITRGPYGLVRHPSYLAYFLMIIGVTLVWRRWFTLLPWAAIPGYVVISRIEEEMLVNKFRDQYRDYMNRVGAYTPKLRLRKAP